MNIEGHTSIETIHPEYPNNYLINVVNHKGNANKKNRVFENTPVLPDKLGVNNVYAHQDNDK